MIRRKHPNTYSGVVVKVEFSTTTGHLCKRAWLLEYAGEINRVVETTQKILSEKRGRAEITNALTRGDTTKNLQTDRSERSWESLQRVIHLYTHFACYR